MHSLSGFDIPLKKYKTRLLGNSGGFFLVNTCNVNVHVDSVFHVVGSSLTLFLWKKLLSQLAIV